MALLDLHGVEVSFSGFRAVAGLDFSVEAGELRCLIGPNGAGKTTTLDVICGRARASAGEVLFDGRRINRLQEHRIARLGIGRKFQVPSVFRELSVRDNLRVAQARRPGVWRNLGRFGVGGEADQLIDLASFVGLGEQFDHLARTLSHGQTQWLEIAMLLAQDARLILLDEPTAGMTAIETRKTAELCKRLKGRQTLIVVEHDMWFVRQIDELISVMHQGRLLAQGRVSEIEANAEVRAAYLGSGGIGHA